MNARGIDIAAARTEPILAMRALSADIALLRKLRAARLSGTVHSVFERVVNVADERGELFTLASRDLDNAPNTIVVDAAGLGMTGIATGDHAVVAGAELWIGPRVILLDEAAGWDGPLPAYPQTDFTLRDNLRIVASRVDRRRDADGGFIGAAMAALEQRAALLAEALASNDLIAAREHGRALIGLGPGLTPSGDDFLVGLFAVLNIDGSPCHAMRSVCPDIIAGAELATNAISLAALTEAARGRVRESIVTLMTQLLYGTRESLIPALDRVLAIGSTSGTDIVAGIVSGFELNLQVGRAQPCQ